MLVVVAVLLAWNAMHEMDIPETASSFRQPGQSIIRNPEPPPKWAVNPPGPGAMVEDTRRHAQRADVWHTP